VRACFAAQNFGMRRDESEGAVLAGLEKRLQVRPSIQKIGTCSTSLKFFYVAPYRSRAPMCNAYGVFFACLSNLSSQHVSLHGCAVPAGVSGGGLSRRRGQGGERRASAGANRSERGEVIRSDASRGASGHLSSFCAGGKAPGHVLMKVMHTESQDEREREKPTVAIKSGHTSRLCAQLSCGGDKIFGRHGDAGRRFPFSF